MGQPVLPRGSGNATLDFPWRVGLEIPGFRNKPPHRLRPPDPMAEATREVRYRSNASRSGG